MFTGIVQGKAQVISLNKAVDTLSMVVELSEEQALKPISLGASIAVNGVCLTVTEFNGKHVSFDVIGQTLKLTNLNQLVQGDWVNIERSAAMGDEIGGHIVSGHIDGQCKIEKVDVSENNQQWWFSYPEALGKYLLSQGFVGLNGCSLTIANIDHDKKLLSVCLIPETLRATTYGDLQVGDTVNLEVERQTQAIVDTVERVLAQRVSS